MKASDPHEVVLRGIAAGRPAGGPVSVHLDVTNGCNAACITCWDHSPLLHLPRSGEWKRRRLSYQHFCEIVDELAALGSVRQCILSGMGEPLTHPDIYPMIKHATGKGWKVTLISNLVAADPERLAHSGLDSILAGVQGVTPASYCGFHPGWTEKQFFALCSILRRLQSTRIRVRHVQVIDRHTAPEVPQMVDFARLYGADRVNYKLAGLHSGTEACAMTEEQRQWLLKDGLALARERSIAKRVPTNLDLFEQQLRAGGRATAPLETVDCWMGYVFTRITVEEEVLFCCNTNIRVGSLREAGFAELWEGPIWQDFREKLARREFFPACEQCGKLEQNRKWSGRVQAALQRRQPVDTPCVPA